MRPLNLVTIVSLLGAYGCLSYVCVSEERSQDIRMFYDGWWLLVIVLMMTQLATTPKSMDFEKQFIFYASYHNNFGNQLIHLCFVWQIVFSAVLILQFTTYDVVKFQNISFHVASIVFAVVYIIYYACIERPAGIAAAGLMLLIWWVSTKAAQTDDIWVLQVAAMVHLVAWVMQFVGHGALEGRAPALLDNLAQSFYMAPLFVILEALSWGGYRKSDFERINAQVAQNIATFRGDFEKEPRMQRLLSHEFTDLEKKVRSNSGLPQDS